MQFWTSILLGLVLLSACQGRDSLPQGVIPLSAAYDVDFELIDHHGQPATDERFEGKPMLIYMGFTSCPMVCPAALGVMTATLDHLGEEAELVQPLFITVDPKHDDVAQLAKRFSEESRIVGLTGSRAQLSAAWAGLKVHVKEVPMPESALGYTIEHQSMFYVTDKNGTPVYAVVDTIAPTDLAEIIRQQL